MVRYILVGMFFMTLLISINRFLMDKIEEKTSYKDKDYFNYSVTFILTYILFGFLFLIFHRKVKEYRKDKYILKELRFLKIQINMFKEYPDIVKDDIKEYNNLLRYIRLKKVQKKIRKKPIWNR